MNFNVPKEHWKKEEFENKVIARTKDKVISLKKEITQQIPSVIFPSE